MPEEIPSQTLLRLITEHEHISINFSLKLHSWFHLNIDSLLQIRSDKTLIKWPTRLQISLFDSGPSVGCMVMCPGSEFGGSPSQMTSDAVFGVSIAVFPCCTRKFHVWNEHYRVRWIIETLVVEIISNCISSHCSIWRMSHGVAKYTFM